MKEQYDCVVVGGGPAGSTAAALVADRGFSTMLVEREKVPRFHVGESLMPETYWSLQRLGVLDQMKSHGFIQKLSVQFVGASGRESQPFFFREHDSRDCSQTWQVERAEFDKMLFDNAAAKGADCFDQTRVMSVALAGDRAEGVRLATADGEQRHVKARVVVDATGQHALIANALGLRIDDPDLQNAAIWGYYRNARRDEGENGGATIILHTKGKRSWFWFIPLSDNIVSIGVVGSTQYLLKGRSKPAHVFHEELANCPALVERIAAAELTSPLRVAKEFSYTTRQQAGDGWVLIGDAFGFIDPVYSSGVYFALKSGEMAADAIVTGLQKGDTSQTQLGSWVEDFVSGTQWIRKLVAAYYTNEFSFGHFLRDFPDHRANLTDLLIGRIFHDRAGRIFDDMLPAIARAKEMAETSLAKGGGDAS